MEDNEVNNLKIVLLGDESVGKSSILSQWAGDGFNQQINPTIGGLSKTIIEQVKEQRYICHVWDTAGAEKYRALTPLYVRGAHSAIIVFDLSRRDSFNNLDLWVDFLRSQGAIPFTIVGNKEDLVNDIEVQLEEGALYALSKNSHFYSVSAKKNSNIKLAVRQAVIDAIEYQLTTTNSRASSVQVSESKNETKCC